MITNSNANRKKSLRFEKDDRLRLIAAVKMRRLLWDMTHTEHSDFVRVKAAWQSVGQQLNRDPNECKVAWRSLRQSYRYHCKTAYTRFKTDGNDDDGEIDPLETPDIQWEFASAMAFLQDMSKKRTEPEPLSNSPTPNAVAEDYTDTEYLEIYDQDDNAADTDPDVVEVYFDEETNGEKNICRTCAQPTDDQTSKYLFQSDNYMILQQITDLTDLILKPEDNLSNIICELCLQKLEIAVEFRKVCIEAQTQGLINVQMKVEPEDVDSPETEKRNNSSHIALSVQEERLEVVDFLDNDNYYEEVDVQLLRSTPSPSSSPKSRTLKKEQASQKYQCHQCGLTFKSQDLLKMHMHEIHEMQLHTRFVCKHCGHDFKYSAPLIEHLKSIGVNFGYMCEDCGQKFHSRHFLKKHKRRVHGQADEHICHICGKNFTTGFNLRNHIVRHAGTRPHKCKLCKSAFCTTAELNNHKRTHDNVRPYPCRYGCGKSFRHCSNRSTHERVHMDSSLRPFQCEYCDKSFVTKGDCRAHQLVHTMSRDFSCEICEQSFKLQKHYQQHLTTKSHKKLEATATAIKEKQLVE